MNVPASQAQILDSLEIEISPEDLSTRIKARANKGQILNLAAGLLEKVQGNWRPRAIIRWLAVDVVTTDMVKFKSLDGEKLGILRLGFASRFMTAAKFGLIGVFTAGDELERESARASKERKVMDAYLYDLIGLAVLEKTRQQINKVVEEKATEMNWGIGPFLSPGSVHGWKLEDQDTLCNFVPMDRIGVTKEENGILKPFKTISCLIGIGPKYTAKTVGATCDVCSNKNQCEMRVHE